MEESFQLISPLPNWSGGEFQLAPGLAVRTLNPAQYPALEVPDPPPFWLCHEFDNPLEDGTSRHRKRRDTALKLMLYATYAIHVLKPCGAQNLFLLYRETPQGLVCDLTERRQPFLPTEWGRRSVVPATFAADVAAMLDRVLEVFYQPLLRLQIPLWLLEQGMAAPDRHIRILLWTTGLDSLTQATGQATFKERLSDLLGADTLIFPPDAAGLQPRYRVGEIAGHLYELRNELAHGLPFQPIYHKRQGFLTSDGQPVAAHLAKCRYDQVLEECAVFLLCRALREVLLSRLIFDIHRLEWCVAASREPDPSEL